MSPHSILLMPSRRDLRAVASIGLVRPKARMRSMQALLSAVLARAILKKRRRSACPNFALPSAMLRGLEMREQIEIVIEITEIGAQRSLFHRYTIVRSSNYHRSIIASVFQCPADQQEALKSRLLLAYVKIEALP